MPLPGAINLSSETSSHFDAAVSERLRRIYGSRQNELALLCARNPALTQLFDKKKDAIAAEVVFSFQSELARTLADCLLRRTMIGLNCDLGAQDAHAAAEIGKQLLGWSEQQARNEIEEYQREIASRIIR